MTFGSAKYSHKTSEPNLSIMQSSNYFWTVEAKAALVIAFIASDNDIEYFADKYDLPQSLIRGWINQFLEAGKEGFSQQ